MQTVSGENYFAARERKNTAKIKTTAMTTPTSNSDIAALRLGERRGCMTARGYGWLLPLAALRAMTMRTTMMTATTAPPMMK